MVHPSAPESDATVAPTPVQASPSVLRLVLVAMLGLALGAGAALAIPVVREITTPHRTTVLYNPPVLAGRHIWGGCSGAFYARAGETVVLMSAGHCASAGSVATDGATVLGVFGSPARAAICSYGGLPCSSPDVNYMLVAKDQIPWGHLNVVDMGVGGDRAIPAGTRPLACADIAIGDSVEIDGRNIYRTGKVEEKAANQSTGDPSFYPCMIAAYIPVDVGDSGGAVLVRGIPAGVTLRSYAGDLGFTPLAERMTELGLTLCTTPDCDLIPPPGTPGT